ADAIDGRRAAPARGLSIRAAARTRGPGGAADAGAVGTPGPGSAVHVLVDGALEAARERLQRARLSGIRQDVGHDAPVPQPRVDRPSEVAESEVGAHPRVAVRPRAVYDDDAPTADAAGLRARRHLQVL